MPRKKRDAELSFSDEIIGGFFSIYLGRETASWKGAIKEKEAIKKFVELDVYLFNIFPKDDFLKNLSTMVAEIISYYDMNIGFKNDDFYTEALERKKSLFNNGNFESTLVLLRKKIKL
jgi:hypothetical protein